MTLSRHIQILKIGIGIAAIFLVGVCLFSWKIIPTFPELLKNAQNRSEFSYIAGLFPQPSPYAAFVTVAASLVYALSALIMIFYFFEKTQSVEVHFFIFFIFSFMFEILRLTLPFQNAFKISGVFLDLSARMLVFCRYFGMFSLFIASLYAAGLKIEKEENILFPLVVITMFLSISVPINIFTYDTSLCMANAYPFVFKITGYIAGFFTVLSFFYGAWHGGTKEYYFIGIGSFLVFIGRLILIDADIYVLAFTGFLLLVAGTYLICRYLRRIYLWA